MWSFGCHGSAHATGNPEIEIVKSRILVIFVYFGRFLAYFGPFRKVQSLSLVETLESAADAAIESYT